MKFVMACFMLFFDFNGLEMMDLYRMHRNVIGILCAFLEKECIGSFCASFECFSSSTQP